MKKCGLLVCFCLLVGTVHAAVVPNHTYLKAMQAELKRSMAKLRRPGVEKPYFIAYKLEEITYGAVAEASLGALYPNTRQDGQLNAYVWVDIGNAQKDSLGYAHDTRYADEAYQPHSATDVAKSYRGLRQVLWRLTDMAYTFAAETYQQKQAYERTKQTDEKEKLPDVIPAKQATYIQDILPLPACEEEQAQTWVKAQSARGNKYPFVEQFYVQVAAVRRDNYYLNSRGGAYITSLPAVQVAWFARIRNQKNFTHSYRRSVWLADFLPENQAQAASYTDEFLQELQALYAAQPEEETYIGPVLIEAQAAGSFLYEQLVNNLQRLKGLSSIRGIDSTVGKFAKEGQRVMAPGITVWDRPHEHMAGEMPLGGFMPVDDEGVAAKNLTLVAHGRVVDLPRTTRPLADKKPSNGHARMTHSSMPRERLTNVVVEADAPLTRADLVQQFLSRCQAVGLPYCYIVHAWPSRDNDRKPVVERMYVDGHTEFVYGVKLAEPTTRSLRDIVAAGGQPVLKHIGDAEAGIPAQSIQAPALVVGELELNPTDEKPDKKTFVPKP